MIFYLAELQLAKALSCFIVCFACGTFSQLKSDCKFVVHILKLDIYFLTDSLWKDSMDEKAEFYGK